MNDKYRSGMFRLKAVEYTGNSGLSIKQASQNLGIPYSTLHRWVRQAEITAGEREGLTSTEREELFQLRR